MSNASDFIIENGVLTKYVGPGGDLVVPNGVVRIGAHAFYKNKRITTLVVPASVTVLEKECFAECRNLSTIVLSERISRIEAGVFSFCVKLEKLQIPDQVITDDFDASIKECWNLKELYLPLGVTVKEGLHWYEGGGLNLYGCNRMTTLVCPGVPMEELGKKRDFPAAMGFVQHRDRFVHKSITDGYIAYILSHKKLFREEFIKNDIVEGLVFFAEHHVITAKNFDADYMQPALANEATACVAFLLDWQNKHICSADLVKQQGRNLKKDPYNSTDMKKMWGFENLPDGSVMITGYKGPDTKIHIPDRIGKQMVTAISDGVFDPIKSGRTKKQAEVLKKITEIEVPEGITVIGREAFRFCGALTVITLPKSIGSIGSDAFEFCENLTVYVSAGSYAETYAKEHNIPFVAE